MSAAKPGPAAIRVDSLSKQYRIGLAESRASTLPEAIVRAVTAPFRSLRSLRGALQPAETLWALKDVSFELQPGEVLGIVGRNGAGKSTLLKILSRITSPSSGEVDIRGRLASLLEVGTGFHAELTGRENIFLNGAMLGMRRREIERKFDEIVEFSGVERFLDTPVKRYSSGMYVRLAFAVAAHLESDILIVDEVLAVGDSEFQKRCLGKMGEVGREGRTVILVSHNMPTISRLCRRCLWLEQGRLVADGETEEVTSSYLARESVLGGVYRRDPAADAGNAPLVIEGACLRDPTGANTGALDARKPFEVEIEFRWTRAVAAGWVGFTLMTPAGIPVFATTFADLPELADRPFQPGTYRAVCTIPADLLNGGRYLISVQGVEQSGGANDILLDQQVLTFDIENVGVGAHMVGKRIGVISPRLPWSLLGD